MGVTEPFWVESARMLARLFERMPDVNPSGLGNDAQKFVASYLPSAGSWDERTESVRTKFVDMDERVFQSVYQTYLSERNKLGFKDWEESS